MSDLRRILMIAMCSVVMALMAGCAVSPETRAKSSPAAVRLGDGQGVVAVQIASNREAVSTFFNKWSTLKIRNVDSGQAFDLEDKSDPSSGHSLFIASLPAGVYEVRSVENGALGVVGVFAHADASKRLPRFRIELGKLADLGTLVYVRRHYPVNSSEFAWVLHSSQFERDAVLRQLEPTLGAKLAEAPTASWEEGERLVSLRAAYAASKPQTMRLSSPSIQADGTMFFGESFGQISVRRPTGEWSWIETPIALPITAIFAAPDGGLYAGADDGILLVRRKDGTTWEEVPLPVDDATVKYVGGLPDSNDLLVILQTRTGFVGMSKSTVSGTGNWKEQFSIPRELFRNAAYDSIGMVLQTDKGAVAAIGGFESKIVVADWDTSAGGWKIAKLDESGPVTKWSSTPGGGIGQFRGVPLTGMYFSHSSDAGRTWDKRGNLNWAFGAPLFVSKQAGYVLKTESIPMNDPEKYKYSLWRTDDLGHGWSKVGPAPAIAGRLIRLPGEDRIGFVSANGKFFSSQDQGRSWRLERELM